MAGLVDSIKNDVKRSGTNRGKFMFFREGQKQRVRFLVDADDGMEVKFHDSFARGINVPCQEQFDRECPYCEDSDVRTRSQYAWSVWDYDAKCVKVFMFPVNNCSPIPALLAMYENYGTLVDRDYVISVSGKGPDKTYSVVPMDKVKFRNEKAKAFSEDQILKMLDKAYPCTDAESDDDDEDERPVKKRPASKPAKATSGKKKQPEAEDDDYDGDQDWGEDEGDETPDYESMTPKELYKLCKERKIDAAPKKPAKYYIKQLEEYDNARSDWDDDDDEDEWEDDE